MMKFHVGQLVWATCNRSDLGLVGVFPAVIHGYESVAGKWYQVMIEGHPCPCPSTPGYWHSPEDTLRPRDNDQDDSRQVTSWDKNIWTPSGVSA